MSIRFTNYNLGAGVQTNAPANVIGDNKAVDATDLKYENIGALEAVKSDTVVRTYSNSLFGMHPWYDGAGTLVVVAAAGTGIYYNATAVKSVTTKSKFSFCEHNSAVYCASADNTVCKVTHSGLAYNMGCPTPAACTSTAAGAGDMNGFYNVVVTNVAQHSSADGGVYQTEGNPSVFDTNNVRASSASLAITNLPVNSDTGYNVVARRLYIKSYSETDPVIAAYYRALPRSGPTGWNREVANNTAATCSLHVTTERDGVDELTPLSTDNALPPRGAYILNHFDHFVIAGNPTYKDRWYFAPVSSENFPTTNWIKEKEEIMGMVEWNNSIWTPTRSKLYVKAGTTADNFYNQDTDVTDGCIAPRTLVGTQYGLIYLSYNGVVSYTGAKDPEILSKDLDPVFLSIPSTYYANAVGIYFDYEYWISFTESGYTKNNVTWIYNFKTKGWRKVNVGYQYFTKDERAFKLYGAIDTVLYRINDGDRYKAWSYRSRDYEVSLTPYSKAPIKFYPKMGYLDIDTKGQNVTMTLYYDDTAHATTLTANTSSRQKIERRLPALGCYKFAFKLEQAISNYKTILYNYNIEVET